MTEITKKILEKDLPAIFASQNPEALAETAGVTMEKEFTLKVESARFSYTKIRQKNLFCGTEVINFTGYSFREAKPLKAIADYLYNIGYEWTTTHPLTGSFRIDIENPETLIPEDFDELLVLAPSA
jgi:hypothetical protein